MKRGKQLMVTSLVCFLGWVAILVLTLSDTVEASTAVSLAFLALFLLSVILLPVGLIVFLIGRRRRPKGGAVWQPPADPASYGQTNPGVSYRGPSRPPDPPGQ